MHIIEKNAQYWIFLHTFKRYWRSLRNINFRLVFKDYISCAVNLCTVLLHGNKLCTNNNGFKVCSLIFRYNYYPIHMVVQATTWATLALCSHMDHLRNSEKKYLQKIKKVQTYKRTHAYMIKELMITSTMTKVRWLKVL